MARKKRRSTLGSIVTQGNHYRARYMRNDAWHTPGHTFSTYELADQWLADEQRLIDRGEWTPAAQRRADAEAVARVNDLTFGAYATRWVEERQVRGRPLKARTAADYRAILRRALAPFADTPITAIDRATVAAWYQEQDPATPVMRAHGYALLRSILTTAVEDGLLTTNPVHIRGAGSVTRNPKVELFTAEEVAKLADLMPAKHRMAVLLAAWCGLRFGELAALRRSDLELSDTRGTVSVTRGVVLVEGRQEVTTPKSASGDRRVPIPPHILPDLREHLRQHAQWGKDGLVFPPSAGTDYQYLTPGQLHGHKPVMLKSGKMRDGGSGYYLARHTMGRDDLSFHKLRHFAATTYAVTGATTKELMSLMGHSDSAVAMRYQHAAATRLDELAARMSQLAAASGDQA